MDGRKSLVLDLKKGVKMYFAFIFSGLLSLGFHVAQAQRVPSPCGRSYKEDSAGRGIEHGFRGTGGRAPQGQHDEACFRMGFKEGQDLKKQDPSDECARDFNRGFNEGFQQDQQSAGSLCFAKGQVAGAAWLRSKARELAVGVVGSECVRHYQRGRNSNSHDPQISVLRLQVCYDTGFYDQAFF